MQAQQHRSFCKAPFLITCMLFLRSFGSIVSTCGGGCSAFSISSAVITIRPVVGRFTSSASIHDQPERLVSQWLAVNENDTNIGSHDDPNRGDDNDNQNIPATGWNHNQPSDSSRFWQAPNGDSAAARQARGSSSTSDNSNSETPRTGWLHNTKSPKSKKEQKEEKILGGLSKAQHQLQQAMKRQDENHRIVYSPTFHACGEDRQIVVTEHRLSVPIYRAEEKEKSRIDVAFSIVEEVKDDTCRKFYESLQVLTPSQRAIAYIENAALKNADDMMLYLQGGPGFGSPIPVTGLSFSKGSSWGAAALGKYKRIVLMDQRGTGQSTPITKQSLEQRFPDLFSLDDKCTTDESLEQSAASFPGDYLKFQQGLKEATHFMAQFRADNIVHDAEMIREALLLPPEPGSVTVPRPWGCSLGQSFGGFCTMTYLSHIDHPPRIALLTGGIAPMTFPAFDVYTALWAKVKERNLQYYSMYPGDIGLVKTIVQNLLQEPVELPSGGKLTARRFLQLGMSLGGSPSSFAGLHNLLSTAFLSEPEETITFTRAFLKAMDNAQPFDDHPIYYWLHEACYCDGPSFSPSNWSANRAFEAQIETQSEVDYEVTSQLSSDDHPTMFFGEMVFPWMSQDYAECSGVGCTALAKALASKDDWSVLYDADRMRAILADGKTRCAAAVYYDDIYVNFDYSVKLTSRGGPLEKCKVYITNEYQHSGLRDDGANLFSKLHGMATGSIRTPS